MLEQYERLPEWLRWILFFPLSILFMIIAVLLLSILRDDFQLMHSAIAIVSLSFAIYALAPRYKSRLVLTSLIIRMLFSIAGISFIYLMGETPNKQTWFEIGRELLGWGIGWGLYFYAFRDTVNER